VTAANTSRSASQLPCSLAQDEDTLKISVNASGRVFTRLKPVVYKPGVVEISADQSLSALFNTS
jgi:hypothetical protein